MPRIRLVRHGHAAAGFSQDHDPSLDDLGRAEALDLMATLLPVGPLPIVVSPLQRTLQTAAPLAEAWGVVPVVDERVAEIPSPTDDLAERGRWLSDVMAGTWADLGPDLQAWRDTLVTALGALTADTVVVSHFIAINALIGIAVGDDRVMHRPLANASITTLDIDPSASGAGVLTLVETGSEATTEVL